MLHYYIFGCKGTAWGRGGKKQNKMLLPSLLLHFQRERETNFSLSLSPSETILLVSVSSHLFL